MFEKIILRRSDTGVALTLGEVAEALLFYQNVHLVLDPNSLQSLGQSLGLEELLALIARKRLTAVYVEDMLASYNQTIGGIPRHSFNTMLIMGNPNGPVQKTRRGRLELQLEKLTPSRAEARRFADQFLSLIEIKAYASNYFAPETIVKSAAADMSDASYVKEAIRKVLQAEVGFEQFAEDLRIEIIHLDNDSFVLQSNINFKAANSRRKSLALSEFPENRLFVALLEANADVNIASLYGGDFYTTSMNSEIAKIRFSELFRRTGISEKHLQQFKDIVLPGFPQVREVINSKERSFKEFELLLDQSDRWRRTVNQMGPDTHLVTEYFKQASREGWAATLPAKVLRFVIGLGIEGANLNPIAKKAWSIADTFLIDKLTGWRPNHFVDEKLKPFLDKGR